MGGKQKKQAQRTKGNTRALQEFHSYCTTCSEAVLRAALPYWPRLYNRLSMDNDRRVREAAHKAQCQVVIKAGRSMAPHLKSLIGPWMMGRCDPHGPAASAANIAFLEAFKGPCKQADALVFCKEEFINHILDMACNQTPQMLCDTEICPEEESESSHNRLISVSLLALILYLDTVPILEHSKSVDTYSKLFAKPKFWKYAKHQENNVRAAWFGLIAAFCRIQPLVIEPHLAKTSLLVFGALDEEDPIVCPNVWEAMLHLIETHKNCWSHVNFAKAVAPKLHSIAKKGFDGNAVATCPNLLPFLSSIPDDILTDKHLFFSTLFANIRLGFALPRIHSSSTDCSAIVSALVECIRFIATNNDLETEFVLSHLLPIVESSLVEKSSTLSATSLYSLICQYFATKEDHTLEDLFWSRMTSPCISAMEQSENEESYFILKRLAYMFSCFAGAITKRTELSPKKSTKRKVNFSMLDCKEETIVLPKEASIKSSNPVLKGTLLAVGSNLCVKAQNRYIHDKSVNHLEFLSEVVPIFATPCLFQNLLNMDNIVGDDLPYLAMKHFEVIFERWLCNWNAPSFDAMDERIVTALVSFVIDAVLPFVGLENQLTVLHKICSLQNVNVLEKLLQTMMKNSTWSKSKVGYEWLRSSELGGNIIAFTETSIKNALMLGTCSNDDRTTWRLLTLCFSTFNASDPILSLDVLGKVLDKLGAAISELTAQESVTSSIVNEVLTLVAKLATGLFHGMPNCWRISACEDILLAFFILLCRPTIVSKDNAKILEDFVADGTALLIQNRGFHFEPTGFVYKACSYVHTYLLKGSIEHLETLTRVFVALLSAINQALNALSECDSFALIMDILEVAFLTSDEYLHFENEIVKWNLLDLMMHGELCIQSPPEQSVAHLKQSVSPIRLVNKVILASAFLASEGLLNVLNSDQETVDDRFTMLLLRAIFASAYCKACLCNRNRRCLSPEMAEMKHWSPKLQSNLSSLIEQLPLKSVTAALSKCFKVSEERGLFWSCALLQLEDIMESIQTEYKVDHDKIMNVQNALACEGTLHNIQLRLNSRNKSVITARSVVKAVLDDPKTLENINCLAILTSGLHCLDVDDTQTLLELLPKLEVSFATNKWPIVWRNVQMCRMFTETVHKHLECFTRDHWDFMLCTLGTWLTELNIKQQLEDLQSIVFATSIFKFAFAVSSTLNSLRKSGKLNPDLQTEWDEFFAVRIYKRLLCLFVFLSERLDESCNKLFIEEYAMASLTKALIGTPASVTTAADTVTDEADLPILLVADWDDHDQSYSIKAKTTLNHLCPLLEHRLRIIQYGAYHSLKDLLTTLSKSYKDTKIVKEEDVKDDSKESTFPGALLTILMNSKIRLEEGSFAKVKFGNDASITKEECECSDIFAYLLAWDLVLKMFSQSSSEIRFRNASYFRENGLVEHLLNCLFILMLNSVNLTGETASCSVVATVKKGGVIRTMFSEEPVLDPEVLQSVDDIRHLACSVYFEAVQHIPALVREWFNGLDRRSSSIVERFTMTNVTPLLCSMDLAAVRNADSAHLLRGLKVRVRPGPREVLAICTVEDISFEIVVRLAENHPLGTVTIEAGRPIGVSNSQWSYWTLQLTTFLMHQNGSILDGLLLWKRNIDKKFEGVQECYVCFYVLHGSSYQLPKHMCRTCKKKFHSSCLYKWFSTSGHSTCPLCRSIF